MEKVVLTSKDSGKEIWFYPAALHNQIYGLEDMGGSTKIHFKKYFMQVKEPLDTVHKVLYGE